MYNKFVQLLTDKSCWLCSFYEIVREYLKVYRRSGLLSVVFNTWQHLYFFVSYYSDRSWKIEFYFFQFYNVDEAVKFHNSLRGVLRADIIDVFSYHDTWKRRRFLVCFLKNLYSLSNSNHCYEQWQIIEYSI